MLDFSDNNDVVMLAEIKRELGDFEGSIRLLKKTFPEEVSKAVSIIYELAKKRNPFVTEIKYEN